MFCWKYLARGKTRFFSMCRVMDVMLVRNKQRTKDIKSSSGSSVQWGGGYALPAPIKIDEDLKKKMTTKGCFLGSFTLAPSFSMCRVMDVMLVRTNNEPKIPNPVADPVYSGEGVMHCLLL